jgi:hypothetical protein
VYVENAARLANCHGVNYADEDMKLEAVRTPAGSHATTDDNILNNLRRHDNKAKCEFHRDEAMSVAARVCSPSACCAIHVRHVHLGTFLNIV